MKKKQNESFYNMKHHV